ncbi:MAG: phosphoglycolate phosphatase [Nitrospinaceae bacterium]|nr:MAG: phosphoglycolate phosphatase [Nitrospinaceae bacterium]
MNKISLIVYDFDGTLVDTLDDISLSVNLALQELGQRQLDIEVIKTCVGRGVATLMTRALNGTGWNDIDKAVAVFRKHYADHLMDHSDFYPNCRETIEHFSNRKQAICSNKPEDFVRKILQHLNCLDPFESIIGGDSFTTRKPDPEGLNHLLKKHNVAPHEVLMVGDSALDIETGKNARVRTCAVTYGMGDMQALQRLQPDWTIDDISELKNLVG